MFNVIIYDSTKFEQIEFSYPGREHEGMRSDGVARTSQIYDS